MKRISLLLALCFTALMLSGCGAFMVSPDAPPPGLLIGSTTGPLSRDFTPSKVASKRGTASATSILGLFSYGNAGIHAAAQDGRLTTIHYVDYTNTNFLLIVNTYTTIAYGE